MSSKICARIHTSSGSPKRRRFWDKDETTLPNVPVYKASTTSLTPDSAPDSKIQNSLYAPGTPGKSYGSRGDESPVYSPASPKMSPPPPLRLEPEEPEDKRAKRIKMWVLKI